jgi:hypothetical protein
VYGALTHDGTVQDGSMRLAFELGLGALLGTSVLGAVLVVGFDMARERSYIQKYYLQHGLVQVSEGTTEAAQIIDKPIVDAIRDGAVRLIDCAWLLDFARSDEQLPRVTKVVARLASNEPRSVLIRRLAKHCGTSSICITVEAASAASPVRWRWWRRWWRRGQPMPPSSTPPSPPEVAPWEVQLEDRSSAGHVARLRNELAKMGLRQLANPIIVNLGIVSVEGLRAKTFDEVEEWLEAAAGVSLTVGQSRKLKAFIAASPSGTELVSVRTVVSERTNASPAQSSTALAPRSSAPLASQPPFHPNDSFPLQPQRSRSAEHDGERNESAREHARSTPGRATSRGSPHPPKLASSALPSSQPNTVVVTFHLSTFDEVAPLTAVGLRRKAETVKERLAELEAEGIQIVMGKPFLPRCQDMPQEAFLSPERAAALFAQRRRGVHVGSYCWRMPGMPDPDGRTLEKMRGYLNVKRGRSGDYGLFVDVACMPQNFARPSWYAPKAIALRFGSEVDFQGPLTVLRFEWERVATEDEAQVCVDELVSLCEEKQWELASIADFMSLGLSSRDHVSVLFHGLYIRGVYRFDEGACRRLPKASRETAEGYVRFRTAGDAETARHNPKLVGMCGGKEPQLMGELVFENELKFKRGLSVMGSLYASATGTCVLQLTDPPGKLGHDVAPSELVSERTGTVFVIEDKSLKDKSLEELQKELGDGLLACEKGSWGKVVVRVDDKTVARAARSLNERGYPLRRNDRKVYPMYNLRPYRSRGWPTFETSAASIVLAHLTQLKRRGEELSDVLKHAEASSLKFINIDLIDAPREVVVVQSPEHLLRRCKKKLRSKQVFFTGKADRKDVVQLLSDFEDSIAVEFDQKRAKLHQLRTEDLVLVRTKELGEARRSRNRKEQERFASHEEPMPTLHVVPKTTVATKARSRADNSDLTA